MSSRGPCCSFWIPSRVNMCSTLVVVSIQELKSALIGLTLTLPGNGDMSNKVRSLLGEGGSLLGLDASAEMTKDATLRWGKNGSVFEQCDCQRDLASYIAAGKAGTFDKVFR